MAKKPTVQTPNTDSQARAAELAANVTSSLIALRGTESAAQETAAEFDARITAAWYPVCESLSLLKPGLFAQLGAVGSFKTFKDYIEETFGNNPKYATVSSYVLAYNDPTVRANWHALGMGAVVAAARIMANKTYSKSEKDHGTKLILACTTSTKNRKALLDYEAKLRKDHRAAPAAKPLPKTIDATQTEIDTLTAKQAELADSLKAMKLHLRELQRVAKGGKSKSPAVLPSPASDNAAVIARYQRRVDDGLLTLSMATAMLKEDAPSWKGKLKDKIA